MEEELVRIVESNGQVEAVQVWDGHFWVAICQACPMETAIIRKEAIERMVEAKCYFAAPPAGGSGAPAGKDLTFLAQKLINYHHPSYESCAVCSEVIVELCGPQPSPAAGSGDKPAEANYVQEVDKSITGQEPSCQVCGAVMTILYRPSGVTCYECLSCGATSQPTAGE